MKKTIEAMITAAAALLLLWILLSWGDVLRHNDPVSGDRQYHKWNAFVALENMR